jgi:hypothetical protein
MATKHTREDRYKAAAAYVATGNSKAAFRESGIPASTIRHWSHNDDDFQMMCQEIRTEFGERIKYWHAQIVDESAEHILDRIRNGDVIRDTKTGALVRVPVKAKELAIINAIAFDKLRLAENQPTHIVQHENSKEHLKILANKFRAIGEADQRGDHAEADRLIRKMGGTPMPRPTQDKDTDN